LGSLESDHELRPRYHAVDDRPRASLTTGELTTHPPPETTLNETLAPGIGCPELSNTTTVGLGPTAVDAVADCAFAETIWIEAGWGGEGLSVPCGPHEAAATRKIQPIGRMREAIEPTNPAPESVAAAL
jgi:hypothetical protein